MRQRGYDSATKHFSHSLILKAVETLCRHSVSTWRTPPRCFLPTTATWAEVETRYYYSCLTQSLLRPPRSWLLPLWLKIGLCPV